MVLIARETERTAVKREGGSMRKRNVVMEREEEVSTGGLEGRNVGGRIGGKEGRNKNEGS